MYGGNKLLLNFFILFVIGMLPGVHDIRLAEKLTLIT